MHGLMIFNISNPSNPYGVGYYSYIYTDAVYVTDSYAYIASSSKGLRIVNVSDPLNLQLVGYYDKTPHGLPLRLYVSGPYAYLASGEVGLQIYENLLIPSPVEEQKLVFKVFPLKVFKNYFTISFTLPEANEVSISIFDISERLIKRMNKFYPSGPNLERFTGLNQGVYFYSVEYGEQRFSGKVIFVK